MQGKGWVEEGLNCTQASVCMKYPPFNFVHATRLGRELWGATWTGLRAQRLIICWCFTVSKQGYIIATQSIGATSNDKMWDEYRR